MRKVLYFMGFLVLAAALFGPKPKPETSEQKAARELSSAKYVVLEAAKRQVAASLRDPSSAEFGQVFIGKNNVVCGTVNARNGFGGYTGMQPFTVGAKYIRVGTANAADTWNAHCAGVPMTD